MTTRIRNERWVTILGDCCGRLFQLRGLYDDASLRFKTAYMLDDKRALNSCALSIIDIVREAATLAEKTRRDVREHFELDAKEIPEIERSVDLYKGATVKSAVCSACNAFFKTHIDLQQKIGRDFYDAVLLAQSYLINGKPMAVVKYLELVLDMLREIQVIAQECELTAIDVENVLKNGVL